MRMLRRLRALGALALCLALLCLPARAETLPDPDYFYDEDMQIDDNWSPDDTADDGYYDDGYYDDGYYDNGYYNDVYAYENSEPTRRNAPIADAAIALYCDDATFNHIAMAADSINDIVLAPGAVFSFNDAVGPRSEDCGYLTAENGRGAEVCGGGVAQVASVIWLAIKQLDCIAVVEKSTYGDRYCQSYVSSSGDAILTDYGAGTDFSFRNSGDCNLTIATGIDSGTLYCYIYEG